MYSALRLAGAALANTIDCGPRGPRATYKLAYKNHPIVLWAKASRAHLRWVLAHGRALAAQYRARGGDDEPHLCEFHVEYIASFLDAGGWPASMPEAITADEWLASLDIKQRASVSWRVARTNPPDGCNFGIIAIDMIGPRLNAYDDWIGSYENCYDYKKHFVFKRRMEFGEFRRKRGRRAHA